MQSEAQALEAFYETPLGQVVRRLVYRRIRTIWPDLKNLRVLGYGFAAPYLRPITGECERTVALASEQLGAVAWPEQRSLTVRADETAFPFPESFFDRILVVHGIENVEATRPFLRQVWRVLAPAGRLIVVAPNRTSLWAQVERSPFAQGRPFRGGQLEKILRDTLFMPERSDMALFLPPLKARRFIGTGNGWEKFGNTIWPRLGGVHIIEATKSLYAVVPPEKVARGRFIFLSQS